MAFGLNNGSYNVKLGSSFQKSRSTGDSCSKFHTVRYDFKPASTEGVKDSYLEYGEKNGVNILIPKLNESDEIREATVFTGSQDPEQKECVLILNEETGEVSLELLDSKIKVKMVRGNKADQTQLEAMRKLHSLSRRTSLMNDEDGSNEVQDMSTENSSNSGSDSDEGQINSSKKPPKSSATIGAPNPSSNIAVALDVNPPLPPSSPTTDLFVPLPPPEALPPLPPPPPPPPAMVPPPKLPDNHRAPKGVSQSTSSDLSDGSSNDEDDSDESDNSDNSADSDTENDNNDGKSHHGKAKQSSDEGAISDSSDDGMGSLEQELSKMSSSSAKSKSSSQHRQKRKSSSSAASGPSKSRSHRKSSNGEHHHRVKHSSKHEGGHVSKSHKPPLPPSSSSPMDIAVSDIMLPPGPPDGVRPQGPLSFSSSGLNNPPPATSASSVVDDLLLSSDEDD